MTVRLLVVKVDSSRTWKIVSASVEQTTVWMTLLVIVNVVERRWKTMSPEAIVRLLIVRASIITVDSKLAKNDGCK